MHLLDALLIIYGVFALIDILLMIVLHFFHDKKGYYKTAIGIWAGILLSYFADGFFSLNFGGIHHIFGIPLLTITTFSFAKLTCQIYQIEIPFNRLLQLSFLTWAMGAVLHFGFQLGFTIVSLVICIGIVAPSIMVAYKIFLRWKNLTIIDRMFGALILFQGLHVLDYPFLRNIENAAIFGFSLGLLFVYIASILVPVVINKRLAEDWNRALEEKVEERTSELIDAKTRLVNSAKMAAIGEMAGGIAHEVNSPLAIIKSVSSQMTEILSEPNVDKDFLAKQTALIEKTTDRIAKIIHGLRVFSRDGSNDSFEVVNVAMLVEETISLCQERFRNHQVRLIIDDIPKNLHFRGRSIDISQVLLNILNNAHDAIAEKKDRWVRITTLSSNEWIEIQVTDCGSGIPPELQEKIFQPFYTTKDVGKGTGLGLSISLGIIHNHQGELNLDPLSPNTKFVIRLPLKTPSGEHGSKA